MPFIETQDRPVRYEAPRDREVVRPRSSLVPLVHGAFDSLAFWRRVYRCQERDHTALATDPPGHGRSGGLVPRGPSEHLSLFDALVDVLHLPHFVLCGHFMGGSTGVYFSLHHAQRLSGLAGLSFSSNREIEQADTDIWDRDPDGAFRGNLDSLFAEEIAPEPRDACDRQVRTISPASCKADLDTCRSFDLSVRPSGVGLPSSLACGDPEFRIEGSRRLGEGIPNSRFDPVPAADHAIAPERPAELNKVLDPFVSSHE